jgi:hypothetical protein
MPSVTLSPSSTGDGGGGSGAWTNPGNAAVQDGNYAVSTVGGSSIDLHVNLTGIASNDQAAGSVVAATPTTYSFGGPGNLWGNSSISTADVNNGVIGWHIQYQNDFPTAGNFLSASFPGAGIPADATVTGIGVSIIAFETTNVSVDYMDFTIYYTAAGPDSFPLPHRQVENPVHRHWDHY